MPFDGSGNYTPAGSPNFPAVGGTVISDTYYNVVINDLATAMSNTLTKDGQGKPSVDFNWNGKSLTNVNTFGAVSGSFSSNLTVGGSLTVTGTSTFNGTLNAAGTLTTGVGVSIADVAIEVGGARTGDGNAYIDLHSTTGTDYDTRLLRQPGTNGSFQILHKGSGVFAITSEDTGIIRFSCNGSEIQRITSGGLFVNCSADWTAGFAKISAQATVSGGRAVSAYHSFAGVGSAFLSRVDNAAGRFIEYYFGSGSSIGYEGTDGVNLIRNSGNAQIFAIGGTECARFAASGSLGIGTTTPGQLLDVNGHAALRGTTYLGTTAVQNIGADTTTLYLRGAAHAFQDAAATGTKMFLDSSGNLGIGTVSPVQLLDVSANSGFNRIQATSDGAIEITRSGGSAYIDFKALTSSDYDVRMQAAGAGTAADLSFQLGGTERFRLLSTGGITSANEADAVGYKGLPQNSQAGAYTLVMLDQGKHVYCTGGAAAVTIPPHASVAFPIGTALTVLNDGSGIRTLTQGAGVTLKWAGTGITGNRSLAVGGLCTLLKVATDTWYVSGAGLS